MIKVSGFARTNAHNVIAVIKRTFYHKLKMDALLMHSQNPFSLLYENKMQSVHVKNATETLFSQMFENPRS